MSAKRLLVSVVPLVVAASILAGCSSSTANVSQFCRDVNTLTAATASAKTPAEQLAAFKAHRSTLDDLVKHAPSAVSAKVQQFVTITEAHMASNNPNLAAAPGWSTAALAVTDSCAPPTKPSAAG